MISRYEANRLSELARKLNHQRVMIEISEQILDACEQGEYSCEYETLYVKDSEMRKLLEEEIRSDLTGFLVENVEYGLRISWR